MRRAGCGQLSGACWRSGGRGCRVRRLGGGGGALWGGVEGWRGEGGGVVVVVGGWWL